MNPVLNAKLKYVAIPFLLLLSVACKNIPASPEVGTDKLYAWCIVPFDSVKRSPAARIEMLQRLGIRKYAYDWRNEHLAEMAQEIQLARENDIEVRAVWMWIDEQWDEVEALNPSNEQVFEILERIGYQGQIWVSFHANFFQDLPDADAVKKGADMIEYLSQRAARQQSRVALYNHGDWFGEPENQIKIIQALPAEELGLIFNFHHAHPQLDRYPEMVENMMPYLWSVNLNGMRPEGPKILPIGAGNLEKGMIDLLIEKGYQGDFGILGHVAEDDVELVLERNLKGLKKLYPPQE